MSETPRTEAELKKSYHNQIIINPLEDFARQLEQELAEAVELLYKASHHSEYCEEIEQFLAKQKGEG